MSDWPERRMPENEGTRKLWQHIDGLFGKHQDEWNKRLDDVDKDLKEMKKRLDDVWKWLAATALTVTTLVFIGAWAFLSKIEDKVSSTRAAAEDRIEKVDTSLQTLKAETGTKVEGIYRFLLEKQRPDIVRQQVEEQRRELAPPPAPINPLGHKVKR